MALVSKTPEEIRRDVLAADAKKDVNINLSVAIAIVTSISGMAALFASVIMRVLVYFRHGVDAYYLTCIPFVFPVITALFVAYKNEFGMLNAHLSVTLLSLLTGGLGYGWSVEPIFINRHLCQQNYWRVPCDRNLLSYLYLVSGALAAGFAVIGFLLTLAAHYSASKRIAKREYEAEMLELHAQQDELRKSKMDLELGSTLTIPLSTLQPASSSTSVTASDIAVKANGTAVTANGAAVTADDFAHVPKVNLSNHQPSEDTTQL